MRIGYGNVRSAADRYHPPASASYRRYGSLLPITLKLPRLILVLNDRRLHKLHDALEVGVAVVYRTDLYLFSVSKHVQMLADQFDRPVAGRGVAAARGQDRISAQAAHDPKCVNSGLLSRI